MTAQEVSSPASGGPLRARIWSGDSTGSDRRGAKPRAISGGSPRRRDRTWSDASRKRELQHTTSSRSVQSHRSKATTITGISVDSDTGNIGMLLGHVFGKRAKVGCKPVFADINGMKERVRAALTKPEYNVQDFYQDEGFCQRVARHRLFESGTLLVIALNAMWIAVDTDFNDAEVLLAAHPIFQIAEHLFCAYFTFEWTMRFLSFRRKRDCLRDAWFVFDSCLVSTMVLETWVMTLVLLLSHGGGDGGGGGLGNASILRMARLLRLTRMARMARLLRAMPELMILIKGMFAAARSVFFTLCLLVIILYIFGVAFTQLCAESAVGEEKFRTVPGSMYTLLLAGTFMDGIDAVSSELGRENHLFTAFFFLFVLLASLTVMNMLIGVICEVVSAVACAEREEMTVCFVKQRLEEIFYGLDEDGNRMLSKDEFVGILEHPEAAATMQDVGVDVVNLIDFVDAIFESWELKKQEFIVHLDDCDDDEDTRTNDGGREDEEEEEEEQIPFHHFMEEVLRLRGSNTSTVKDIVDLQKYVKRTAEGIATKIENNTRRVEEKLSLLRIPNLPKKLLRRHSTGDLKRTARRMSVEDTPDASPHKLHPQRVHEVEQHAGKRHNANAFLMAARDLTSSDRKDQAASECPVAAERKLAAECCELPERALRDAPGEGRERRRRDRASSGPLPKTSELCIDTTIDANAQVFIPCCTAEQHTPCEKVVPRPAFLNGSCVSPHYGVDAHNLFAVTPCGPDGAGRGLEPTPATTASPSPGAVDVADAPLRSLVAALEEALSRAQGGPPISAQVEEAHAAPTAAAAVTEATIAERLVGWRGELELELGIFSEFAAMHLECAEGDRPPQPASPAASPVPATPIPHRAKEYTEVS